MRYFSMFSGIGGFELGLWQAHDEWHKKNCELNIPTEFCSRHQPHVCVGYSEIDKYAIQVYEKHFNQKNYGDATTIKPDSLPDFDLLVGGFPCQSFSIAGKREGFTDTRGTLFFEIARIVREKQPRLLLLENVKGLLSHDKGCTFRTIISTLDELGYDCQWQVLNSKNFGVPQNRERVFIIGYLRGTGGREVFPIRGSNSETLKQIIGGSQGNRVYSDDGLAVTQASQAGGQGAKTGLYAISRGRSTDKYKKTEIAPTVRIGDKDNVRAVLTPDRPNKRQNGRRMKEDGEPSFTLTAQDKHGIYDGSRIRRLTPVECERLQGFPDGWTEGLSDTQRYKCLGNAVTVNVPREIFKKLI